MFEKPDLESGLKRAHGPAKEDAINAQLDLLLAKAKADKWKVTGVNHTEWKKYYDLYAGGDRHWRNYTGSIGPSWRVTNNKIERNINIKLALIAEMDMAAEIVPAEPGDEVTAYLLDAALKFAWEKRNVPFKLKNAYLDALILGTGFVKVFWNYELDDNDVMPLPPESVFPAPGATSLDRDRCPFVVIRTRMSSAEARHKWKKAKDLKGEAGREDEEEFRDDDGAADQGTEVALNMSAAGTTQPTTTASYVPGRHISSSEQDEMVWVEEWYLDDPDRKKYPTGRMIIRVGQRIVEDKKNPYRHAQWPVVAFRDTIIPHRIWGATTLKAAAPIQRELNIMESLIVYNTHTQTTGIRYTFPGGVPKRKLERGAGRPGVVYEVASPMLMPKMEFPNPLPHGILEQRNNLLESLDHAMRIQETVPPGARGWPASGEVVEQMRESQQVEIRDTADNFAEGIGRVASQVAANTQQFYNEERFARIVGPLPKALEGLTDPNTGDPIVQSEGDNLHYVKFNPDNLKKGFDTSVVDATWQPLSKKSRFDVLMDLQERFPDDVTIDVILDNIDLKGKEKILRAYRERQEAPPPPEEPMPPDMGMPPDMMSGPPMGGAPPMGMPPMGGPPPMMGPM